MFNFVVWALAFTSSVTITNVLDLSWGLAFICGILCGLAAMMVCSLDT